MALLGSSGRCVTLSVLGLLIVPLPASAQDQGLPFQQLIPEMATSLESLESFYAHARGKVVFSATAVRAGQGKRVVEASFARDGDRIRFVATRRQNLSPDEPVKIGQTVAMVHTSDLSFLLHREPDRDEYTVRWIGSDPAESGTLGRKAVNELRLLDAPFNLSDLSLVRLIRHPTFKAKQVSRGNSPVTGRSVRVDYEANPSADPSDPLSKWASRITGSFMVSPDRSWAIQSFEIKYLLPQGKPGAHLTGTVAYEGLVGGHPLLKRVEIRDLSDGRVVSTESCEVLELQFGPVPDDDFEPEAFGIRGLSGGTGRSPSPRLWFALAGGALILLAVLIRYGLNRARSRVS